MRIPRRSAVLILMPCLLVLQAQLWASAVLGCRHEGRMAAPTVPLCRHQPSSNDTAPARLFDCHKCVLQCLVTVAAPLAPDLPLPERFDPPTPAIGTERHFYRFVPRLPDRPPRA